MESVFQVTILHFEVPLPRKVAKHLPADLQ